MATVQEVIETWVPGTPIPIPEMNDFNDILAMATWMASNEHIPADIRARAAREASSAQAELDFLGKLEQQLLEGWDWMGED